MAGHSHSKNIRIKKGKTDSIKSKNYQKINKELIVALKIGGVNEERNLRLKNVIKKAKTLNVPKDVIENTIKSFSKGKSEGQEKLYEGYGPERSALLIECSTDNVNRSAATIKSFFNQINGNITSTIYLFEKVGEIKIKNVTQEEYIDQLLEVEGIKEINNVEEEKYLYILCEPKYFNNIINIFGEKDMDCDIRYKPLELVKISEDKKEKLLRAIEKIAENPSDTFTIYTNIEGMEIISFDEE